MANIPKFGQRRRVARTGASRPTATGTEGLLGQTTARLGQSIQQTGRQVGGVLQDLESKRRQAEVSDFVDNTSFEYRRALVDGKRNLEDELSGTNYAGYTEKIERTASELEEEMLKGVTDQEKAEAFKDKIRSFREAMILTTASEEHKNRAQFYTSERLERAKELGSQAFRNPDPFLANEEVEEYAQELKQQEGVLFNKETTDTLTKATRAKVRESVVAGQIRDGLPGIVSPDMTREEVKATVSDFVQGKISGTEQLFQDASPEERRKYSSQMLRAAEAQHESQVQEVFDDAESSIEILSRMDTLSPELDGQVESAAVQLQSLPPSEERNQIARQLENARTVHEFRRAAHYVPNEDLMSENLDEQVLSEVGFDTAAMDLDSREDIKKAARDIVEAREEDGAAYIEKISPEVYTDKRRLIERQERLGIKNPRVYSKEEAGIKASAIMEEPTPELRSQMLDNIREEVGPELSFQAINEISEANKDIPSSLKYSMFLDNAATRNNVVKALSDTSLKENYTRVTTTTQRRELTNTIGEDMREYMSALNKMEMRQEGVNFAKMVEKLAQRRMTLDPEADAEEVASNAVKEVVYENFHVLNNENANIVAPKSMVKDPEILEDFTEGGVNQEYLKSFGLKEVYDPENKISSTTFWRNVQDRSFWSSSPSGDGIVFMAPDPATGVNRPVLGKEGQPIEVRYDEMSSLIQNVKTERNRALAEGRKKLEKAPLRVK